MFKHSWYMFNRNLYVKENKQRIIGARAVYLHNDLLIYYAMVRVL